MSLGIGLGAFMQGMGQGIRTGQSLVEMRDQSRTRDAARDAYAKAQEAREAEIQRIEAGGAVAAARDAAAPPPASPPSIAEPATSAPAVPRRGDAPQAVSRGIAARANLDPNSPTYAQDIARINDGVVAQTMPGSAPARPTQGVIQPPPAGTAPPTGTGAAGQGLGIVPPAVAPAPSQGAQGLPQVAASGSQPGGRVSRVDAERQAGDIFDFYVRTGAPRVVESMLANGNVEGAQRFQTWIRGEEVQRGMRSWAGAIRAAQAGDADGFLRFARQAYNNNAYSPDGVSVTAGRVLRDGGNVTGMELTFRNRDGSERTQTFAGATDLYRQAISFLAPEQQFQFFQQELTAARTAQTQLAVQDRTRRSGNQDFVFRQTVQDGFARGREALGAARTARRDERQNQQQIERDNNNSWNRSLEAAARNRGETVAQVQRQVEQTRSNMAGGNYDFGQLPIEEQNRRALAAWQNQRGLVQGAVQPPAAAPATPIPVYRPPAVGQPPPR